MPKVVPLLRFIELYSCSSYDITFALVIFVRLYYELKLEQQSSRF